MEFVSFGLRFEEVFFVWWFRGKWGMVLLCIVVLCLLCVFGVVFEFDCEFEFRVCLVVL